MSSAVEMFLRQVVLQRGIPFEMKLPERFPIYTEEPWKSLEMRWLPVDNYLVFYFTDETAQSVDIARIMYRGRDIRKHFFVSPT